MWRSQPNVFVPSSAHAVESSHSSSSSPRQRSVDGIPETRQRTVERVSRTQSHSQEEMDSLRTSLEVKERELIGCRSEMARQRGESEQLRRRVEAHIAREAFLTSQFEQVLRQRELVKSQLSPDQQRDLIALNEALTKENRSLHRTIDEKESELEALRTQIHDMRGKLQAYEDVWMHREAQTKDTNDAASLTQSRSTIGSHAAAMGQIHAMLSDSLSGIGFVKRALVAVQHCEQATHDGVDCRRSKPDCVAKCLRAALTGNTESQQESRCRTYGVPADTVARTLRQEVGQCETMVVKLAAHFLTQQSTFSAPQPLKNTPAERASLQRKGHAHSNRCEEEGSDSPRAISSRDENCAKKSLRGSRAPRCSTALPSHDQRPAAEAPSPTHSHQKRVARSALEESNVGTDDGGRTTPKPSSSSPTLRTVIQSDTQEGDPPTSPTPHHRVEETHEMKPLPTKNAAKTPDARPLRPGPLRNVPDEESDTKECDVQ